MVKPTFVYLVSDTKRENLTVGWTHDMLKTIEFYKSIPTIINTVRAFVYVEEYETKKNALNRFEEIVKMTKKQKKDIVETVNPEYQDLIHNF